METQFGVEGGLKSCHHLIMPPPIAQTNLQFYRQLHELGWPIEAIKTIQADYEALLPVMSGLVRGCGKPILSHLIGTASVLARENLPVDLVRLGLSHAVYQYGLLNLNGAVKPEKRRADLRAILGTALELDVFRYRTMRFGREDVEQHLENFDSFDDRDRRVLTVYLANEVDDHLDGSCLMTEKPRKHHEDWLPLCLKLADRLNVPGMASLLQSNQQMEAVNGWMRDLYTGQLGTYRPGGIPKVANKGLLARLFGRSS